ncbi:MAG: tryptophan-rich sensory protein [Candidatus Promineifilaceae bacterium]
MNILAFAAVLVVNFLSNALPINGKTAQEISDALPSYFTPAGYTFAIWGLVYLALLGFVIYQALPGQRQRPFQSKIGWLFVVSSVLNISWLFSWHYEVYPLSVVLMVALLVTLITIYQRLNIGRPDPSLPTAEKLLVQGPFSLYLGWITVATIANIASFLVYLGWDGFGIAGPTWSAIMISAAVVIAGLLLINRRNLAYAGVLVWAFFGIRTNFADIPLIANAALVAAVLVVLLAALGYYRTRQLEEWTAVQTQTI